MSISESISEMANSAATKIMGASEGVKNSVMSNFEKMANPQPSPEGKNSDDKSEEEQYMDDIMKMAEEIQKMVNQMFAGMVLAAVNGSSNKNAEAPSQMENMGSMKDVQGLYAEQSEQSSNKKGAFAAEVEKSVGNRAERAVQDEAYDEVNSWCKRL